MSTVYAQNPLRANLRVFLQKSVIVLGTSVIVLGTSVIVLGTKKIFSTPRKPASRLG